MSNFVFDQYVFFASAAVLLAIARYATYFISIHKGETKPHAFSWLLWGVMVGIGAAAQFQLGGGPSAWALAFVSASCLFIAVLACFIGERNYTKSDWVALLASFVAIIIWQLTDNPTYALIIIICIDCLSYYPTFRKSYHAPDTEPPVSYFLAGLRYFLMLFAVPNPSLGTLIYPFFLMLSDWGFAVFLMYRRWQLGLPIHEYTKVKQ